MNWAHRWFIDQGCQECQVVTQRANRRSCRLYARCGYRVEQVQRFYHFWL